MKYFVYLFVLLSSFSLYAREVLPQFLDNGNAGTEFYLTFLPARSQADNVDNVKVYVLSTAETEVTLEVKAHGFIQKKQTKPNAVTEFILPVTIAQAYSKTETEPAPKETVYRQQAVHIFANDPIVVYGLTNYQNSREGFLAIPVSALGKEYILSSWGDAGDNGTSSGQYLPSEAGIVAPFDNTKVTFTLGGNPATKTVGGMKPGETKTWHLQKGDVLMFASLGKGADFSGSKIVTSRPVAVISGSYCASIPNENTGNCNHTVEMETPTHTWGKEYIVTKIFGRKRNSILKIMAKDPDTKIYINGQHKNTIATAGGVEGTGYIVRRPDEGDPANFIVTADKPICVTQFNTGPEGDSISNIPFQLALPPVDHFVKELVFATPDMGDGTGFSRHYVNVVFELDEKGDMPADLEFALVENSMIEWMSLAGRFGFYFEKLPTEIDGKRYGVKTLLLSRAGVYCLRSPRSLSAYSYGFSDHGSYAFPAGASYADRSGGIDTLPPVPVYNQTEGGDVLLFNTIVSDSNAGWNSRLASATLIQSKSFNYEFSKIEFIPGESISTMWRATVIDKYKPARAVIVFIDRAGNDTTITLEFEGVKIITAKVVGHNFQVVTVGLRRESLVRISSTGNTDLIVSAIDVPQSSSFIVDLPTMPFSVRPGEYRDIRVYFEPHNQSLISENVAFHTNVRALDPVLVAVVSGRGRQPSFVFNPLSFSHIEVGSSEEQILEIKNTDSDTVRITSLQIAIGAGFTIVDMPQLPLVIEPGMSYKLAVRFSPADTGSYDDELVLKIHELEFRRTLTGWGVKSSTSVHDVPALLPAMKSIYPNPAREEAMVQYTLPVSGHVRLVLSNVMGEEVLALTDGVQAAGSHTIRIPTSTLPSGMYMCRLTCGNTTVSGRVVIVH